MIRRTVTTWLFALAVLAFGAPEKRPPAKPGPDAKCPVCGMFIAKFPDFLAEIIHEDGTRVYFDGTKDMMKYYSESAKYRPPAAGSAIEEIYVTDYYSLKLIDGREAFYVAGSDVFGPMGRELIPLAGEDDAADFKKDHKGSAIYRFGEITPEIVRGLD